MNLRRVPLGLVVALAALVVHGHAIRGTFHYDDENVILLNRANLEDASTVLRVFREPALFSGLSGNPMFRPVAYATHVLDARLGRWTPAGPDPLPFHATNLLLHAAAALVLYHLLRRILRILAPGDPFGPDRPSAAAAGAFLGAIWFALQPANSEVVNYVSARSESLAALFFLLALWAHHAAWEDGVAAGRRTGLVAASVLAALLSFGSKETGALLPVVAGGLELFARPGEGTWKRRLRDGVLRALPLALALALYLSVRHFVLGLATVDLAPRAAMAGAGIDPLLGGGRSLAAHLLTQSRVAAAYALLLLFPVDLAPDHGVRVSPFLDLPTVLALLGLAVLLVLTVRAGRRGCRAVPLCALWTAAAAAPSVLVPLNVLMNEHRLYLPSTGLALGAGLAMLALLRAGHRAGRGAAAGLLLIALFSAFTMVDVARAMTWADPFTLWSKAVATSPTSWRNHLHLGVEAFRGAQEDYARMEERTDRGTPGYSFLEYDAKDLLDFSLEEFRRAQALYPRAFETRLDLGFLHLFRGEILNAEADPDARPPHPEEYQEAIRWFTLAEESSPGSFRALYNRATAMAKAGDVPAATAEFERLAQDRSRTTMYAWPLADLYRRAGRFDDALAQFDLIGRLAPGEAGTLALRRGEVLTAAARYPEAEKELRRASGLLGKQDPLPPLFMARLLAATGLPENLPAARALWRAALERGHRPGPKDRDLLTALGERR